MSMKINNRVIIKILCILLLVAFLSIAVSHISSADIIGEGFPEKDDEFENGNSDVDDATEKLSATIINVVRVVAATIATVMLFVLAMKYMMSSAGDRADIKKHAVAYIVGAFILFGAVGILGILDNIGQTIGKN